MTTPTFKVIVWDTHNPRRGFVTPGNEERSLCLRAEQHTRTLVSNARLGPKAHWCVTVRSKTGRANKTTRRIESYVRGVLADAALRVDVTPVCVPRRMEQFLVRVEREAR